MPTLTNVRIKSFMNGGIQNVFEMTDQYTFPEEVLEDNILY